MASQLVDPKQLKKIRTALGITQQKLADLAGVSQSLIAKIEAGKVDPAYGSMKAISEILGAKRSESGKRARDVMSSPVVSVDSETKLSECVSMMKKRGISQVPVMEEGRVVGSMTEVRILELISEARNPSALLGRPVRSFMGPVFPRVSPETPIDALFSLFNHASAVIVSSAERMEGIIAKIDILAAEAGRA